MNFSECISPEEEILHQKIVSSVESLKTNISKFKKNQTECLLCTENLNLHNVHDLTRIYSLFLHCIKYHCVSVEDLDIKDIFLIEIFLLKFVNSQDKIDIEYITKYNNNTNETLYRDSLRNQLVAIFNTHFQEKMFKINCEQEIESLAYIYYKKIGRKYLNEHLKVYLLVIFFIRREYFRFMKIFNLTDKTTFVLKLAILFEIEDDNDQGIERLLKELNKKDKNLKNKTESNIVENMKKFIASLNGKYNLNFSDILDLFKCHRDHRIWIDDLKSIVYWQNCVKLWSKNRSDTSSYVDNSMIDICIKYKKYEDGWNIYEGCQFNDTPSFLRGITLCCSAIKNIKHCKWRKRLVEVINNVFYNKKDINFESVLENLLTKIENLPVNLVIKIINELQIHLIRISLNEEQIECLFNFYNVYCYSYQNTELNKICCQNAIYIYTKWNRVRTSKLNFFKKKTEFDTKIYSHMLGICDIAKNCDFFNKVCKDLIKNEAHISRDLCRRLENFHSKNCKNCDYKKKQIVTAKESRGFITHLFE
ncbi:hypothetical protein P3W45_001403 [Vairimorpha bombi]|jgi:hypothetical protein